MTAEQRDIAYICTHLGEENAAAVHLGAVVPPIFQTSLHVFDDIEDLLGYDVEDSRGRYFYGRVDNPTTVLLEQKLAALEAADGALCFASGMAAISAAILHAVRPGGHVVTVHNVYGPARSFLSGYLKRYGVEVSYVSGMESAEFERAIRPNTCLFYLESPTSAVLELQDLEAVSAIARAHGIMTAIDNTWATPIHQNPLQLGIDIVVHTMSKYIGGHSDIIGGALCARSEIISAVKTGERELIGGILGPFDSWLALRGLRTMPARLAQSGRSGRAVAAYLQSQARVRRVNYPGLEGTAQYELARRQMRGGCGLLSFELDGTVEQSMAFADRLRLFRKGVSWGGFESLVCMPMFKLGDEEARSRNANRNLIRLYCGLEDEQALLEDVEHALCASGLR